MIEPRFVTVDGLRLAYREMGEGPAVLLLHGWPMSSHVYRNILPELAKTHRAIALDLPGFGASDKPDVRYGFRFFAQAIGGFLEALGVEETALVLHDLGGPVGLFWGLHNREKVSRIALLNTLVYPQVSWTVAAFMGALRTPGLQALATSATGLRWTLKVGMQTVPSDDLIDAVLQPFEEGDTHVLVRPVEHLRPEGFEKIATELPKFEGPVALIYGERDHVLPGIEKTMTEVKAQLPQAEVVALPECGHFLQEDCPAEVAGHLARFLNG